MEKIKVSQITTVRNNDENINRIHVGEARKFLITLGPSQLLLNESNKRKIYEYFPVPIEHIIIWADCEFDLRCSGIVCTDRGCFIKSNVGVLDEKINRQSNENGGKSILFYYMWDQFNPSDFVYYDKSNYALTVDQRCQRQFIATCLISADWISKNESVMAAIDAKLYDDYTGVVAGIAAGAAASPNPNLEFIDKYIRNVNGRHGFFAEYANNLDDQAVGRRATIVGGDNAKNGADRLIEGVFGRNQYIQTKYYSTAYETINAGFGDEGFYKYVNDEAGIMQLEVPKDQYADAVWLFARKIQEGKVLDANGQPLNDPHLAFQYVRKGHYTYEQAVRMAEPGNIDSLMLDFKTGVVSCTFAFGISALITMVLSIARGQNLKQALREAVRAGVKVFGITMVNHILLSQLYRTDLFQNFTGNLLLRDALVTTNVSIAFLSMPNVVNVIRNNISFGQFLKNTAVVGGSVIGGTGGAILGAEVGEFLGGTVGKIVGSFLGGFLGGVAGSAVAKGTADVFREDDMQIFLRLFNAKLSSMAIDYLLNEDELAMLAERLKALDSGKIQSLNVTVRKSSDQEWTIQEFLAPIFKDITSKRKKFTVVSETDIPYMILDKDE